VILDRKILIWDSVDCPVPESSDQIVLWRSYGEVDFPLAVSIPALVEQNAVALRDRYLAWLYELGSHIFCGKRFLDHLQLRPDFSYWWMTLFAEKSSWAKSPLITDAIRLFAFEDWVKQLSNISSIKLVSSNKALTDALSRWCDLKNINFQSQPLSVVVKKRQFRKRILDSFPHALLMAVWLLKYLVERWPLRGVGVDKWRQSSGRITFISYLFNLVPKAIQAGRLEDLYWTCLPKVLDEKDIDSCWLYVYVKSPAVPDARSAARLLGRFNDANNQHQTHVTLDSFLSINVVLNTIRDYLRVRRFGRLKSYVFQRQETHKKSTIESVLLPLFSEDWDRSFFGLDAISNLLMLNLFERAFCDFPKQRIGVYLQENQGWESAMIHAWRSGQHDNLIGFPHSTVQFWNLSYFFDSRIFCNKKSEFPKPNLVAVSGDSVRSALVGGGYPSEKLIEDEALRYLSLYDFYINRRSSQRVPNRQLRVLVMGDYLSSNTFRQMEILRSLSGDCSDIVLTVKPHPACPINPVDYPELRFEVSNEPLSELLSQFDVAYTSSATSAAVEAYCAGLQVISVLDPEILNLSPLRGIAGVEFVSSPEQLLDALKRIGSGLGESRNLIRYFNTDSSLSGWKSLLSVPT